MKKTLLFVLILFAINIQAQTTETFHDFNAVTIRGDSISLSIYAGKKILVVNTASYCGFTPQYADLEALYLQYGGPNFEILGFPCNDFGGQEPGSNGSIDSFCTGTYNISFQMMSRISITAPDTAEVYKWLQNASRNGVADAPVAWNFNKFLIDEAGNWVAYYPSSVNPLDTAIVNWILSPNTTGIKNQDAQFVWTIAGNPVKDVMRLQFSNSRRMNCTFDIFDIHGRQLLMNTLSIGPDMKELDLPVHSLPDGLCLVRMLDSEGGMHMQKVIIQN
ncbi:MAG TPA: hypothetical protein PKK99_01290 [Bacteroidia bacterium]|nr:hypothetical protein [Bacteroidia bacterium]